MKFRNVTHLQLVQALDVTSHMHYAGNLCWNRGPDQKGNAFIATIRAKDSHKAGARLSASGRHSVAASWHAHRDFFRTLLTIAPGCVIDSGFYGAVRYEGLEDFEAKHPATRNLVVHGGGAMACLGDLSI